MPKYLPGGQLAECMRSGQKCLASQLVRDGRNPQLLVLPEWADEAHPQERPFIPDDVEGRPRFPVAPDQGFDVLPVLAATLDGANVVLTWTEASTIGPRVETYTVYRAAGAGAYSALDTLEIDFGNGVDDAPVHPVTYTDETAAGDTLYHYRVDAGTDDGRALRSNVEDVTTPSPCVCSVTAAQGPAGAENTIGYFLESSFLAGFGAIDQSLVTANAGVLTGLTPADFGFQISEITSSAQGAGFFVLEISTEEIGAELSVIQSVTIHDCVADTDRVFDIDDPEVFDPAGSTGTDDSRTPTIEYRLYRWSITEDVFTPGRCYTVTIEVISLN